MEEADFFVDSGDSEELKRLLDARTRDISALHRAARISGTLGPLRGEALFRQLGELVTSLLDVEICGFLLYDPVREALVAQRPVIGVPDKVMDDYEIPLQEGSLAWRRWQDARSLVINDVQSDPLVRALGFEDLARRLGVHSTLISCLRHEGGLVGVMQLCNKRDDSDFDDDDLRLLSIFGRQAVITIQNERLFEQAQQYLDELASLYRMTSELAMAVDLDEMLRVVLEQVRRILDYDACLISLATADGKALRVEAVDGQGVDDLLGIETSADSSINGWIYREGEPLLVADADLDPRRLHIEGRTESIRAAVGAPLIVEGQTIGTIYATRHQPYSFTEDHLNFLVITAAQVAAAVERARLLDRATRRAQEMETLLRIAAVMASNLDVDQILETIYEESGRIMDTWAFWVAFYNSDTDELSFPLIYEGGRRVEPFSVHLEESQSPMAHVVRTGQSLLIRDWQAEREHLPFVPVLRGEPCVSWLGVPLIFKGEILGAIGVQSYEPYAFLVRHQRLLAAIAYQASINLQNARLLADLKLVNTDLQEMVAAQAHLLNTIEEMVAALNSGAGLEELRRMLGKEPDRG